MKKVAALILSLALYQARGSCVDGEKQVSLLNSGASYCIKEDPCSGIYHAGIVPTKTGCPAQGQESMDGGRIILKPTCCAIINNSSMVLGCVFEAAKYTCIAPSPAPIPITGTLPPHSSNAAEVALPTTVPVMTTTAPSPVVLTTSSPNTANPAAALSPTKGASSGVETSVGAIAGAVPAAAVLIATDVPTTNAPTTSVAPTTNAPTTTATVVTDAPAAPIVTEAPAAANELKPGKNVLMFEADILSVTSNSPGRIFISDWKRFQSDYSKNAKEFRFNTGILLITGTLGTNTTDSLLELFNNFKPNLDDNGLLDINYNQSSPLDGEVLVQLYVNGPISSVELTGTAECFVDPGVLVSGKKENITLSTTQSNLYVDASNVQSIANLNIHSINSGSVQFIAKNLTEINTTTIENDGDGNILLFLNKVSLDTINSHTTGSGDIHFWSSFLKITNLTSQVDDAGSIIYASGTGTCENQEVMISGIGNVETERILCTDTDVEIDYSGRGDATVQSSNSITTDVKGPGNVLYYNTTPHHYPSYKKHFYQVSSIVNRNESAVTWPTERVPNSFHVATTESTSWLGSLSVADLDRIIIAGCIIFLILVLLYIFYRLYKRYNSSKKHGGYTQLQ
ncbi:hypothetical protein THRCLA_05097 [Thraustotheca clavata]|uniref:Putative auto-transporter adhesin head GIN domain-containing protein n=1 Tax=Thraustotheca clavata TaxID=74557 RepID=A0A1V9ZXK6_9STRA|nr:hypothetical protein THRCLA_05097 [Thraustotheca clavata]